MGKTLEDLLAERPGNPEVQEAHMKRMLAEVRAYKPRELREMLALTQTDVAETLSVSQKRAPEIERCQGTCTKDETLRRSATALGAKSHVRGPAGGETNQAR